MQTLADRNRETDLIRLSDEFIDCLYPDYSNSKRPFGSSDIGYSVCNIIGVPVREHLDYYTNEELEYGEKLYEEMFDYIKREWGKQRITLGNPNINHDQIRYNNGITLLTELIERID